MAEHGAVSAGSDGDDFPQRPQPPLPLAISQCLLGSAVRYDGSAAGFALPHAALANLFDYRGICPEVGIGLGTPRAPIRLVGDPGAPQVLGVDDMTLDVTERLRNYGEQQAATQHDLAGYVFMRGSPSCGLFDVKVHARHGSAIDPVPTRTGRGAYAAAVVAARPHLPVEENGRLHDPLLRDNFVTRTFAYAHWRGLERAGVTGLRLSEFHRRYRYLLMAHSQARCAEADALMASTGDATEKAAAYVGLLMAGLSRLAGRRGHVAVLAQLRHDLDDRLDGAARRALDERIRGYRRGELRWREVAHAFYRHLRRQNRIDPAHEFYLHPIPMKVM